MKARLSQNHQPIINRRRPSNRGHFRFLCSGMCWLVLTAATPLFAGTTLTWTVNMTDSFHGATLKGTFAYDSVLTAQTASQPEVINPVLTVANLYFADPTYPSGARMNWTYNSYPIYVIDNILDASGGTGTIAGNPFTAPSGPGYYPDIQITLTQSPGLSLAGGSMSTSAIVTEKYNASYSPLSTTFSGTISAPTPVKIRSASISNSVSGGGLNFTYTNLPGFSAQFIVWGSTNLAPPNNQWINLGHPTETTPGVYQFFDTFATNSRVRFYRVSAQ